MARAEYVIPWKKTMRAQKRQAKRPAPCALQKQTMAGKIVAIKPSTTIK